MIRNDHLIAALARLAVMTKRLASEAAPNIQVSSEPYIVDQFRDDARNLCSTIQDIILTLRADARQFEPIHDGKEGGE